MSFELNFEVETPFFAFIPLTTENNNLKMY